MYLKFLQKLWCLGSRGPKQAKCSAVKKTRRNSSKDNFVTKSFRLSTKTKLSTLLNFPFPFASFFFAMGLRRARGGSAIINTIIIFLISLFHVLSSLSFVFLSYLNSDHNVWCSKYLHLSLFSLGNVRSFTN